MVFITTLNAKEIMKYSNKNTSCKNCCFAQYENITQVGCSRGLIEKFKEASTKVVECYDQDAEFFVIQDRKCPYFRTKEWLNSAGDNVENLLKHENQIAFHAILFANNHIRDLDKSLKSLATQDLTPSHLTVIRKKFNFIKPRDIVD